MTLLRREVLRCFKNLHRARKSVFGGDENALKAARIKINEGFSKNKHVTNTESISELLSLGVAVEQELKKTVIQAVEVSPGKFEAKITPDTVKLENVMFKDMPDDAYVKKRPCKPKKSVQ